MTDSSTDAWNFFIESIYSKYLSHDRLAPDSIQAFVKSHMIIRHSAQGKQTHFNKITSTA